MLTIERLFLVITLLGISAHWASAQQSQAQITAGGVTISEPGVYELAGLFKHADIVALVKIVSGDTENYNVSVCKAEVVKSFKGTSTGDTIYFGECIGERLGWEYVVFLQNTPDVITPRATSSTSYGKVQYAKVFNEGYSSMVTSYACIFDGKEIAQKCDYGVRVCTDYIKLPRTMRASPPESNDPPFGCRWVRKTLFMSQLDTLGNPKR
jgi:hypothetical protein